MVNTDQGFPTKLSATKHNTLTLQKGPEWNDHFWEKWRDKEKGEEFPHIFLKSHFFLLEFWNNYINKSGKGAVVRLERHSVCSILTDNLYKATF